MDCIQVVALILENQNGEILVSQRAQGKHLEGLWEFPGGKLEPEESHFQALQREIMEELGYQIQEAKELLTLEHQYPEKKVCIRFYHAQDNTPEVHAIENQPLKWVTVTGMMHMDMPEADQPVIAKIRELKNL